MANGNGNGAKTSTAGEINDTGSAIPSNGRPAEGPKVKVNGAGSPAPAEAPKVTVPAPFTPKSNITPVLATSGLLALGGAAVYGIHKWRQSRAIAAGPSGAPLPNGGVVPPPQGSQTPAPDQVPAPSGNPPPLDPKFWGTSNFGLEYRALLTKIEEVARMPLRLCLSVVANRESGWNRNKHNTTPVETNASKAAIAAGPKRGNPTPKFANSIAGSGSGGLFGALAPYVAWTGLDEGFMPYLDEDYTIIEDPIVAAICAAKYYQRIVTYYPTVFASGTPTSEDNYRVRLGWANPSQLKENPSGKLFGEVKGRMDEDLAALGLKITDLPPPDASRWPGLKAVVEGMKGFTPTWK